jgi:hypothetical protein
VHVEKLTLSRRYTVNDLESEAGLVALGTMGRYVRSMEGGGVDKTVNSASVPRAIAQVAVCWGRHLARVDEAFLGFS